MLRRNNKLKFLFFNIFQQIFIFSILSNMMNTLSHKLEQFLDVLSSFRTSLIVRTIEFLSYHLTFFRCNNPFELIHVYFITNNEYHYLLTINLLIYLFNPIFYVVFGINIWAIEKKKYTIRLPIILLGQRVHSLVACCIPYTHRNYLLLIIVTIYRELLLNSIETNSYWIKSIEFFVVQAVQ